MKETKGKHDDQPYLSDQECHNLHDRPPVL